MHLQKKDIFGKDVHFYHIPAFPPSTYFTVSAGQEVDFAPVIAMNFTC